VLIAKSAMARRRNTFSLKLSIPIQKMKNLFPAPGILHGSKALMLVPFVIQEI